MSTTNGGAAQATDGGAQANAAQPQLNVLAQYVKDLSFENPNAPRSLQQQQQAPQINIQINVNIQQLGQAEFEVALILEGKAENEGSVMFAFELTFAGIFQLPSVQQELIQPLLLIECPRLLFPFAREMIATAVRNGGFVPLLLDPVDFVALYQQRMAQANQQPTMQMPS